MQSALKLFLGRNEFPARQKKKNTNTRRINDELYKLFNDDENSSLAKEFRVLNVTSGGL